MNNNENKKIIFDTIGYGEKKCLMALYSVAEDYLDNIYFVKQNDLWQAYYVDGETKTLICSSVLIFEVCSTILRKLNDENLSYRFINRLRTNTPPNETDEFINDNSTIKIH
jgi:hypothetical protein